MGLTVLLPRTLIFKPRHIVIKHVNKIKRMFFVETKMSSNKEPFRKIWALFMILSTEHEIFW